MSWTDDKRSREMFQSLSNPESMFYWFLLIHYSNQILRKTELKSNNQFGILFVVIKTVTLAVLDEKKQRNAL